MYAPNGAQGRNPAPVQEGAHVAGVRVLHGDDQVHVLSLPIRGAARGRCDIGAQIVSSSVPVIDLAPWFGAAEADRAAVAAEVDAALQSVGFFLVTGHGVPDELRARVRAEARGYRRVSLETGTMDAFAPARALYRRAGFWPCAPFGPYRVNPYSICMTMALAGAC